jgi:hypothetical protein
MAIVKTERKPFLDRLQQSVQIGTQIAGVVQAGQEMRQQDVMLKQRQETLQLEKDRWAQQSQLLGAQLEAQQLANTEAADQSFTKLTLRAAMAKTPDERAVMFRQYKGDLAKAAALRGTPMSEEDLEFHFTKGSAALSPYVGDLNTGLSAMAQALQGGRVNRDAFLKGQQVFDQAFYQAQTLAPALSGSVLQKSKDDLMRQFEQLTGGETEITKAYLSASTKGPQLTPAQEAYEKEAGKGAAEGAKGGGFSQMTIDQLDRGVSLLVDKGLKVGPLAGMAPIAELRKLVGDVKMQEFEYITKGAFMAELMKFAKEVGVRGIDTEKEQEAIRQAIVNLKQNPELAVKALLKIKATALLANEAQKEKQAHITSGGMMSDFTSPAATKSAYVPRSNPGKIMLLTPEEAAKRKDLVNITNFTLDETSTTNPSSVKARFSRLRKS